MKLVRLKRGNTIRHSPSRCEAMGEGGRRPGEGSFFDREKHFNSITFTDKEPSPALSGTLSHPGGRERGEIGDSSTTSRILMVGRLTHHWPLWNFLI